jgi:hypothetical protein
MLLETQNLLRYLCKVPDILILITFGVCGQIFIEVPSRLYHILWKSVHWELR